MRIDRAIVAAAALVAMAPVTATAGPVYRYTDEAGVTHYSSKPPTKDAKPANLPEIMRGEVKLPNQGLVTCNNHGGVDCQAGPDGDGSVICTDGFKGAVSRYRFSCNSPKLQVADVSELTADGGFSVFVRNSSSVKAKKPSVLFKEAEQPEVSLEGPEEIEPFGMGEFVYKGGKEKPAEKPTIANLTIACANCPG